MTPTFYVHFNARDLRIQSISTKQQPDEDNLAIAIDYDLGLKFMTGELNPISWAIGLDDKATKKTYVLKKIEAVKLNRLDIDQPIYEVGEDGWADVNIVLNKRKNIVEIHYSGERIQNVVQPVRMYFTKNGDPAYLKCAFTLNVNILNIIKTENGLSEWPNPIKLKMDDVDDLSIFAMRGPLSVSIHAPVKTK